MREFRVTHELGSTLPVFVAKRAQRALLTSIAVCSLLAGVETAHLLAGRLPNRLVGAGWLLRGCHCVKLWVLRLLHLFDSSLGCRT